MSAVHFDRDGRARCGTPWQVGLTADREAVTCGMCLNLLTGTHGIGNRRADLKPCGTIAAYRRHHRRGELLDESCRQARARDKADRMARMRERGAQGDAEQYREAS
jgi:hypothetical protein